MHFAIVFCWVQIAFYNALPYEKPVLQIGAILRDRYEVIKFVGEGGAGHVYQARDLLNQNDVAIKALVRGPVADIEVKMTPRSRINGRCISILDSFYHGTDVCCIVYPLLACDLQAYASSRPLSVNGLRQVGYDVALAIKQALVQDIVQNDVKTENILVEDRQVDDDADLRVQLSDFGVACRNSVRNFWHRPTPYIESPEITLLGQGSVQSDIWSFGLLLVQLYQCTDRELLNGYCVISRLYEIQTFLNERVPDVYKRELYWNLVTQSHFNTDDDETKANDVYTYFQLLWLKARHLVGSYFNLIDEDPLFDSDAMRRFKFEIQYPFKGGLQKIMPMQPGTDAEDYEQLCDLIQKCIRWLPQDRITVDEILQHPFLLKAKHRESAQYF
ncbi:hypothetical protein MP228_012440 [Amoeboaphelidium protococcarum]|nr:hypothetical protein MP228_012440 [Amoeboaphelidium protococcarum]